MGAAYGDGWVECGTHVEYDRDETRGETIVKGCDWSGAKKVTERE